MSPLCICRCYQTTTNDWSLFLTATQWGQIEKNKLWTWNSNRSLSLAECQRVQLVELCVLPVILNLFGAAELFWCHLAANNTEQIRKRGSHQRDNWLILRSAEFIQDYLISHFLSGLILFLSAVPKQRQGDGDRGYFFFSLPFYACLHLLTLTSWQKSHKGTDIYVKEHHYGATGATADLEYTVWLQQQKGFVLFKLVKLSVFCGVIWLNITDKVSIMNAMIACQDIFLGVGRSHAS